MNAVVLYAPCVAAGLAAALATRILLTAYTNRGDRR